MLVLLGWAVEEEVGVLVGDAEVVLVEEPEGGTLWSVFMKQFPPLLQLYPNGQHCPAHVGRLDPRAVVLRVLSGYAVTF